MSFIERLQNKPRFIRVQILWISVILVMVIIFSLWLIYLKSSLQFSAIKQEPSQEKESVPSLFSTLKEDFSLLKKSLQAGVKGVLESDEEESKFEVEIIRPKRLPE